MADLKKLSEGTVTDIEGKLSGLSDDELRQLHDMEEQGAGRTTLLSAIDRETDKRSETKQPDNGDLTEPYSDASGTDTTARDDARARDSTMEPKGGASTVGQTRTVSGG